MVDLCFWLKIKSIILTIINIPLAWILATYPVTYKAYSWTMHTIAKIRDHNVIISKQNFNNLILAYYLARVD